MRRFLPLAALVLVAAPAGVRGDAFDRYTNDVLAKVPGAPGVKQLKQLTPALLAEHGNVLPGVEGTFLVVKTNEGRFSKLLVQPALQKIKGKAPAPILLIERFVTFREGEERTVQVQGKNVRLFNGFVFNLDMGQVVPASVGGDIRFVAEGGKSHAEPVGQAEFYLVTKPLAAATPKKAAKLEIGSKFEPRYFNGAYKVYDDGRRTGTLHLKVSDKNEVSGWYYSGKDGKKYEVGGKIGSVPHAIQFTVTYPRTMQTFYGMMFTGDGRVITGTSILQERETGWYAVRSDEE